MTPLKLDYCKLLFWFISYNLINDVYNQNVKISFSKNTSINNNFIIGTRARNAGLLLYKCPRTKAGKLALEFSGPWAWNQLPCTISELKNYGMFKSQSKKYFYS